MKMKMPAAVVAAAAISLFGVNGMAAQEELTPEATVPTTGQTVEPRDEGFDDWGLLGLLGLAGLAGLRRQPQHTTVVEERIVGTPTTTRRP